MAAKRYTVQTINGTHIVLDNGEPMGSLFTSPDEAAAQTMAANLNTNHSQPVETSETEPAQRPTRPGWSKAARSRAGRPQRSHPFGKAVEAGSGYTVYEDTAFGGGRVQIWDES